jgi:hypothetical protein
MSNKLYEGPFLGPPEGGVPHAEPDGLTSRPTDSGGGMNALRDLQPKDKHPPIESGDWQVQGPGRGYGEAPVHNITNRTSRRHG